MMDIKPLESDREYREALAEVERLMRAEPGTLEGEKLDVLATLVEAYEAKYTQASNPVDDCGFGTLVNRST